MYNPEFRITRDFGSTSSLGFFNPGWAKFPRRYVGGLLLSATLSALLCQSLRLTDLLMLYSCAPWKVLTNTYQMLWGHNQIDLVKILMRVHLSPKRFAMGFQKLVQFLIVLDGCKIQAFLSFTSFRGALKVVGGSFYFEQWGTWFFLSLPILTGKIRNQNLLSDTMKRREKDTTNSAVTSSLSLISYITISDFFYSFKKTLFILESGKIILIFLFCIS